jgi:hypothetical protein
MTSNLATKIAKAIFEQIETDKSLVLARVEERIEQILAAARPTVGVDWAKPGSDKSVYAPPPPPTKINRGPLLTVTSIGGLERLKGDGPHQWVGSWIELEMNPAISDRYYFRRVA